MAEDGIGITGAVCLLLGGVVAGKVLSRWESKLDRHVVCEELDRFVKALANKCQTADQHRELMEIQRGIDQVRSGQIPFDDGPGFIRGLWDKSKALASKVSPAKLWRRSSKSDDNGTADQPVEIKTPGTAPSAT